MRPPSRTPVSRHPAAPLVTLSIVIAMMAGLAWLSLRWDLWRGGGRNFGTFFFVLVPPVVLVFSCYDAVTSWLDRLVAGPGEGADVNPYAPPSAAKEPIPRPLARDPSGRGIRASYRAAVAAVVALAALALTLGVYLALGTDAGLDGIYVFAIGALALVLWLVPRAVRRSEERARRRRMEARRGWNDPRADAR